jgi:hypothetical protein
VLAAGGKTALQLGRDQPALRGSPEHPAGPELREGDEGARAGIRDCIVRATGKEPDQAIDVRVRFDPSTGAIDQVRVLDMGATNPIAGCIDEAVRGAAPPSAGRPNESFTFFKTRSTAPR